jgi:hypothetical protein
MSKSYDKNKNLIKNKWVKGSVAAEDLFILVVYFTNLKIKFSFEFIKPENSCQKRVNGKL